MAEKTTTRVRSQWRRDPTAGRPAKRAAKITWDPADPRAEDLEVLVAFCGWGETNKYLAWALQTGATAVIQALNRHDPGVAAQLASIRATINKGGSTAPALSQVIGSSNGPDIATGQGAGQPPAQPSQLAQPAVVQSTPVFQPPAPAPAPAQPPGGSVQQTGSPAAKSATNRPSIAGTALKQFGES